MLTGELQYCQAGLLQNRLFASSPRARVTLVLVDESFERGDPDPARPADRDGCQLPVPHKLVHSRTAQAQRRGGLGDRQEQRCHCETLLLGRDLGARLTRYPNNRPNRPTDDGRRRTSAEYEPAYRA